jgi:pyrroloquinoline-quinone synthase
MSQVKTIALLDADGLEAALRQIGAERYHNLHPFHRLLHDGKLSRAQVQAWALNRYAYQRAIPRKDAALIARSEDAVLRRDWRRRLVDHDGDAPGTGGVARWRALAIGVGVAPARVDAMAGVLPATIFAVEAYVNFVRDKSLLEAVASSLTEMFSPAIISERVSGMLKNYDFILPETLAYFTPRLTQAPRDVEFALEYVRQHAVTVETQQAVLAALRFKCDVLWAMLDALYFAYVEPGFLPPGCFDPGKAAANV